MEDRVLDWAVYEKTAREMAAEGLVLLKNDNKALPLKQGETVSVFGRMQNHYYKSGTGSGGMVNVARVVGILDALNECKDVNVNQKLAETYAAWDEEHPVELGTWLGTGAVVTGRDAGYRGARAGGCRRVGFGHSDNR